MNIFKSYLRQLIRQLKKLEEAKNKGDEETEKRIIKELLEDAQKGLEDD